MENAIELDCPHCDTRVSVTVSETADDREVIACPNCGREAARAGLLHARLAQQADGIGAGDLADDHFPLGGPPFGSTT